MRLVWRGQLANCIAPVSALVAPAGRYVVTFDNWAGIGVGPNIIVIYDAAGAIIRSLALRDFLPDHYIRAFAWSYGSVYWSGEHRFSPSGEHMILAVRVPNEADIGIFAAERHIDFQIELSSGRVIPPDPSAWANASNEACRIVASNQPGWHVLYDPPLSPEPRWPPFPVCQVRPIAVPNSR